MNRLISFRGDDLVREKIKKRSKELGVSQSAYVRMLILKDK